MKRVDLLCTVSEYKMHMISFCKTPICHKVDLYKLYAILHVPENTHSTCGFILYSCIVIALLGYRETHYFTDLVIIMFVPTIRNVYVAMIHCLPYGFSIYLIYAEHFIQ